MFKVNSAGVWLLHTSFMQFHPEGKSEFRQLFLVTALQDALNNLDGSPEQPFIKSEHFCGEVQRLV